MTKDGYASLRKGRVSIQNHIYHITAVTLERKPLFNDFYLARSLIHAFKRQSNQANTLAFVVMPDHFHWLIQLETESADISQLVLSVKTITARYYATKWGSKKIWQRGFYDHAIRKEEDIVSVARYIVANPLRAGISSSVRAYSHWDAIWLD